MSEPHSDDRVVRAGREEAAKDGQAIDVGREEVDDSDEAELEPDVEAAADTPGEEMTVLDTGVATALLQDLARRRGEIQIVIADELALKAYGEAELIIDRLPGLNSTRFRLQAREQPKTEPAAGG